MKTALIFGVTGQDGAYLSRNLLSKGYNVVGVRRRASSFNTHRINDLLDQNDVETGRLTLRYGDVLDTSNMFKLINQTQPDEIYNLAAQSHVGVSFDLPDYTSNVDAIGTLRLLDAAREIMGQQVKIYQASTSELYGYNDKTPIDEKTKFYPKSPYACAKLYSFWIMNVYRESYGMHCSNGILFNHESPLRGETFVTRKITRGLARIYKGEQSLLKLGNLDAVRDWGHASDYVEAMWRILQLDDPVDLVIGTGSAHTVREFCEKACQFLGWTLEWSGNGDSEIGTVKETGQEVITVDPLYYRPNEVPFLLANPSLAKKLLSWSPKITFDLLVEEMMQADLKNDKTS